MRFGGGGKTVYRRRTANEFVRERLTHKAFHTNPISPSRQLPEDYLKSLLAPHAYKGVKIPDLSCYPSTTFSEEEHITWIPSPSIPRGCGDILGIGLKPGVTYEKITSKATIGVNTGLVVGSLTELDHIISTDLQPKFRAARLVSACASVTYTGNGDTNRGTITCSFVPFGKNYDSYINTTAAVAAAPGTIASGIDTNISLIKDYIDSYQGPLKYGASVCYRPTDTNSLRYVPVTTRGALNQVVAYGSNVSTATSQGNTGTSSSNLSCGYGYFIFALEGFDESTSNVQFDVKIVANWEAIPMDDDTDAVIAASPVNGNATAAAFAVGSAFPSTGSATLLADRTNIARSLSTVKPKTSLKRKR